VGARPSFVPTRAGRGEGFQEWLEQPRAGLGLLWAQIGRFDRLQFSLDACLPLGVENRVDQRAQLQQRFGRGFLIAVDHLVDRLRHLGEHRRLLARFFQRLHELLEAKTARSDDAAGNRQPARFVVDLV